MMINAVEKKCVLRRDLKVEKIYESRVVLPRKFHWSIGR